MNIHKSLHKIVRERERQRRKYQRVKSAVVLMLALFLGIFIGNVFLQNNNISITGFVASGSLPNVGGSTDNWGNILNNYLLQEHTSTGAHGNVTAENLSVSGDVNVTGNANITGNLSVGDKITFRFGEVIDNLVDGLITITGDLNISNNLTVNENAKFEKNVNVSGNLTIQGNISNTTTPDANTLYAKSLPKAWVNFDGTDCTGGAGSDECTIRDSFNVDNVTRTSTGQYTVYWDRDFANSNYVVTGAGEGSTTDATFVSIMKANGGLSVGSASIVTRRGPDGFAVERDTVTLIAFGEQ